MARRDDEEEQLVPEEVPHLADGGLLDSFSVDGGDSDTLKGLPLNPAAVPVPQMATPADPAGNGPKPAVVSHPTALEDKASNPSVLPGMPADVTPDELERYLGRAKDSYQKYGADQQMDASRALLQARFSPGSSIANAGAGFADALMQGVAGAGNPGFQKNMQDRQQQAFADTTGAMKNAHDTAMGDTKANMEIDSKDPESPLSRASQKAYASTLIAAGIPKDAVGSMSADLISDVGAKRITLADALARIALEHEYKMGELGIQGAQLHATVANQQAQRKSDAAKALEGRGVWRRVTDKVTGNPATKALEQELTPGATDHTYGTEAEAEAANIPDGTRVTIGGKTGTWRHR